MLAIENLMQALDAGILPDQNIVFALSMLLTESQQ